MAICKSIISHADGKVLAITETATLSILTKVSVSVVETRITWGSVLKSI